MKQSIKEILVGLSMYYQIELKPMQLEMYADDLMELTTDELKNTIQQYRRNPKNIRFPLPAALIAIAKPEVNPDHEAIEASNRIWAAIGMFGYNHPASAKEYIGELGWAVVKRNGGWASVCQESNDTDGGTMKAQFRESAKAVYGRSKQGRQDEPPSLPSNVKELPFMGVLLKKM